MKLNLNHRLEFYNNAGTTLIDTLWAHYELASISLMKSSETSLGGNKYQYLVFIRKHPRGFKPDPIMKIKIEGNLFDIDIISETRDGKYYRFLCVEAM